MARTSPNRARAMGVVASSFTESDPCRKLQLTTMDVVGIGSNVGWVQHWKERVSERERELELERHRFVCEAAVQE